MTIHTASLKKYHSWLLIIPPLISLSLYFSSLNYFFFQDDFYEIIISRAHNFQGFISLFKFLGNRSSYRPIGLQTYFFTSYSLFGLNPVAFRAISFTLFFISYFLIIKVIKKITNSHNVGFLTASLWVISAIHFMSLTWIAASWLIIGLFLFLTASIFILNFSQNERKIYYTLSFIFFVLSALSFEFFVSFPLIFGYYFLFIQKKSLRQTILILSPFLLAVLIYAVFRSRYSYLPKITEYQLAFNFESLKALFWYGLWSLNVPEEFKKQIVTYILVFNKNFLSEFWPLVLKSFLGAAFILFVGIIMPITAALKKSLKLNYHLVGFSFVWFLAAILPVLILPNHTFAMYLTLPSIGVYLLISYLSVNFQKLWTIAFIMIIWTLTSFSAVSFYRDSSWIYDSQRFAKEFTIKMKSKFATLPPNAVVLYPLNDNRHIQALLDQNAIRVIYDQPSIIIYYDKQKFFKDLNDGRLIDKQLFVY